MAGSPMEGKGRNRCLSGRKLRVIFIIVSVGSLVARSLTVSSHWGLDLVVPDNFWSQEEAGSISNVNSSDSPPTTLLDTATESRRASFLMKQSDIEVKTSSNQRLESFGRPADNAIILPKVPGNESFCGEEIYYDFLPAKPGQNSTVKAICSNLRIVKPKDVKKNRLPFEHGQFRVKSIDRIYYINLDQRPLKRDIMESWLSKQPIPYQRVSALRGEPGICVADKNGTPCIGISGVARSNLHIMDNLNTTGITLVLEDDIVIRDMDKLLESTRLVPPEWDILRWDCWDDPLPGFTRMTQYSYKVSTWPLEACERRKIVKCWHCGGNHIAMWRGGESLKKLRRLWGSQPHDDIDCQLRHPSITTYCIQVGVGEFHIPLLEKSDIVKIDNP